MKPLECTFFSRDDTNTREPYVHDVIKYSIEDGFLEFDGHFRISDDKLPLIYLMFLSKIEEEPYKIEGNTSYYHSAFEAGYRVEIHKCERFEDTSVLSEIDEDGERMYVCFSPTERIRIEFRVLERCPSMRQICSSSYVSA